MSMLGRSLAISAAIGFALAGSLLWWTGAGEPPDGRTSTTQEDVSSLARRLEAAVPRSGLASTEALEDNLDADVSELFAARIAELEGDLAHARATGETTTVAELTAGIKRLRVGAKQTKRQLERVAPQ